jgi:hypothetical protein
VCLKGHIRCALIGTRRSSMRRRTKLVPRHRPSSRAVAVG